MSTSTREPAGILTHPYTVPSTPDSPYYSAALWDWDSWFISAVLGQVEADTDTRGRFFVYEEGCKKCYACGHSEC